MRRVHLLVGFTFLAIFALTGLYMRLRFPAAYGGDPTMRMLFRSAHLYLLLAALLNGLLGLYLQPSRAHPQLQGAGSILLLFAPVLFTLAFFVEPAPQRLERPWVALGAVCAVIGSLLHLLAQRRPRAVDSSVAAGEAAPGTPQEKMGVSSRRDA